MEKIIAESSKVKRTTELKWKVFSYLIFDCFMKFVRSIYFQKIKKVMVSLKNANIF